MGGPLDLSGADLKGFDPIEPGRYNAEVVEMTSDAVKNADGSGKMPAGTPMIKVQFRITDEPYENRRVFVSYTVPPKDYDEKKAAQMKGMIVRMFVAFGNKEEDVLTKKFDPDYEDYIGRTCVVVVGKEQKKTRAGELIPDEFNNPVKGIKPAGSIPEGSPATPGLL